MYGVLIFCWVQNNECLANGYETSVNTPLLSKETVTASVVDSNISETEKNT